MDDIREWFNGKRDYTSGVELYLAHGDDDLLIRLFSEGFSEFKMKKLVAALEEILSPTALPKKAEIYPPPAEDQPNENKIAENRWSKKRDEVEEALYHEWDKIYSEMMNLVARVGEMSREATNRKDKLKIDEAGRMALRILNLDDQCDAIYFKRDFYRENKRLPEDDKPITISLDPNLWPKRLQNHQRYAREFRKQLDKNTSNAAAAAFLKKHEWAVSEYKKLLKME
jgi:hypothetical protein